GGRGDGHNQLTANAVTLGGESLTVLYAGGLDDGHDSRTLNAASLAGTSLAVLFAGGPGDGHDHRPLYGQTLNGAMLMLYGGGPDDGHDSRLLAAGDLNGNSLAVLYTGGSGDGHSHAERLLSFIPFPLTLVRFDATDHGTYVLLEWETEDEIDTDFFTIQKTRDGLALTEAGNLAAAGYTVPGERRNYQLRDEDPWTGTTLYRLRTTDFDGAEAFSDFVSLSRAGDSSQWDFDLYPNPSTGTHFQIRPGASAGRLEIQVFDKIGRLIVEKVVPAGTPVDRINLPNRLPPGSYLIRATDAGGQTRVKVLLVGR
ncbi:MAG: T9SS type A sorting domain-containing protein, partial [Lewinella sp.]